MMKLSKERKAWLREMIMVKELPCPHCGQDINIPARYNAENIAQLEEENRQLRRIIEVNAPDVDIEYNLSQLTLSLSETKEKYFPNKDIDELRKKPDNSLFLGDNE